ncbi:MAG: helix-turn-helix domain-containing protein [Saprospiraceae bacterium]
MRKLRVFEEAWLRKIDELIEVNLNNSHFTTESLAFQLNLSKATLYRKVVKLLNIPPSDYIRQKKLEKARMLASSSRDYSIKELASMVGYSRHDHFAKIYGATY